MVLSFASKRRHPILQGDWSSDVCSSDLVAGAIEAEAKRQGVDPALAKGIGWLESKLNPAAASGTSSAKGVFQFTDATRAKFGQAAAVPAADQIVAGVTHTKQNVEELKGFLGRDPTATEAYL